MRTALGCLAFLRQRGENVAHFSGLERDTWHTDVLSWVSAASSSFVLLLPIQGDHGNPMVGRAGPAGNSPR